MKITKPASVANDAFKSQKWDELTAAKDYSQADVPF